MSKYYAKMTTTALRDELDRLEEQLDELEDEDLSSRAGVRNRIFYICDILCRRETAAWPERRSAMTYEEAYELYRKAWRAKLAKGSRKLPSESEPQKEKQSDSDTPTA